jgi:hypothetical protein
MFGRVKRHGKDSRAANCLDKERSSIRNTGSLSERRAYVPTVEMKMWASPHCRSGCHGGLRRSPFFFLSGVAAESTITTSHSRDQCLSACTATMSAMPGRELKTQACFLSSGARLAIGPAWLYAAWKAIC